MTAGRDEAEAPRLPASLEVGGLIRRVQAAGGFATVLRRGEADAGTLLLVLVEPGADVRTGLSRVFERMPVPDGTRRWTCTREDLAEPPGALSDYLDRRVRQDQDLWIVELDIADAERFVR